MKRPFLALVMEGAGNGTAPWEIAEHIGMGAGEFPGRLFAVFQTGDEGQSIDDIEGKKAEEAVSLSSDLEEETLLEDPAMDENSDPEENETEEETASPIQSEFPDEAGEDLPGGTEAGKTYEFRTVTEDYFDDAAFIGDYTFAATFNVTIMKNERVVTPSYEVVVENKVMQTENEIKYILTIPQEFRLPGRSFRLLGIGDGVVNIYDDLDLDDSTITFATRTPSAAYALVYQ